jgi:hypothetical protein
LHWLVFLVKRIEDEGYDRHDAIEGPQLNEVRDVLKKINGRPAIMIDLGVFVRKVRALFELVVGRNELDQAIIEGR